MSITDELREWARGFENVWVKPASKEIVVTTGTSMPVDHVNMRLFIEGMLDRVDAEHERTVGFCKRLEDAAAKREDVEIFGVEYTALPLDADGEYIHIGDVMEWCDSGETLTVEGIGSDVLFYIDGENAEWTAARNKRHHAPTVEDVLREFADEVWNRCCEGATASDSGIDELVAECAAKLRLAGENVMGLLGGAE